MGLLVVLPESADLSLRFRRDRSDEFGVSPVSPPVRQSISRQSISPSVRQSVSPSVRQSVSPSEVSQFESHNIFLATICGMNNVN